MAPPPLSLTEEMELDGEEADANGPELRARQHERRAGREVEPTPGQIDARLDRLLSGRERILPSLSLLEEESDVREDRSEGGDRQPEPSVSEVEARIDRLVSGRERARPAVALAVLATPGVSDDEEDERRHAEEDADGLARGRAVRGGERSAPAPEPSASELDDAFARLLSMDHASHPSAPALAGHTAFPATADAAPTSSPRSVPAAFPHTVSSLMLSEYGGVDAATGEIELELERTLAMDLTADDDESAPEWEDPDNPNNARRRSADLEEATRRDDDRAEEVEHAARTGLVPRMGGEIVDVVSCPCDCGTGDCGAGEYGAGRASPGLTVAQHSRQSSGGLPPLSPASSGLPSGGYLPGSGGSTPNSHIPAAISLIRRASLSPGTSPKASNMNQIHSPSMFTADTAMGAEAEGGGEGVGEDEDEDIVEEVEALVSAATESGIAIAARTLKEAMSSAGEQGGDQAAAAMARALADSLLRRLLVGGGAEAAALRPAVVSSAAEAAVGRTETTAAPERSRSSAKPVTDAPANFRDVDDEDVVEMCAPQATCNPRALLLAAELVPLMPPDLSSAQHLPRPGPEAPLTLCLQATPRLCLLRGVLHTLRVYMANCLQASKGGVFPALVRCLASSLLRAGPPGAREMDVTRGGSLAEAAEEIAREEIRILGGCIRLLAAHTLPVAHLRMWLAVAAGATGEARGVLLDNLDAALRMRQSRGPRVLFQMDGESSGVLGASVPGSWPFNDRGFTFVTWVYLESLSGSETAEMAAAAIAAAAATAVGAQASPAAAAAAAAAAAGEREDYMPRLFSFLSTEEGGREGVEAYFHGQYLVLEANGAKAQRASMPFTHSFKLKQWACVAVEYCPVSSSSVGSGVVGPPKPGRGGAGPGEARLYIDGVQVESRRVSLPHVKGSLGFCCVGTNPPAAMAGLQRRRRQCALYGSLGPVYVFREAIGARHVAQLASRGGSYVPGYGVSPPAEDARANNGVTLGIGLGMSAGGGAAAASSKTIVSVGARGIQLAGAAAKAVAKAAAGGGASRGSSSSSSSSSAPAGGGGGSGPAAGSAWASSSPPSSASSSSAAWAALDNELAPALLQLLHPALVPSSGPASKRVPDLAPGPGKTTGRSERMGAVLGGTCVARRELLRDALWAVSPSGPAALVPLVVPALCARTFEPRGLHTWEGAADWEGDGRVCVRRREWRRRVVGAAGALRAVISIMGRAGEGDAGMLDALAAADTSRLLAHALFTALDALRRACLDDEDGSDGHPEGNEARAPSSEKSAGRPLGGNLGREGRYDAREEALSRLDRAEVAVVEAVEGLLDASRDHPPLHRQLCSHLFLSLEPWVGGWPGARGDGDGSRPDPPQGIGVPALRRILQVGAALAHAEGGAVLRQLCGMQRMLDMARQYLGPGACSGPWGDDGDGVDVGLSLCTGGNDDESGGGSGGNDHINWGARGGSGLRPTSGGRIRGATVVDKLSLLDEVMVTVSTLMHGGGGGDHANEAAHVVGVLADHPDPHLASRILTVVHRLIGGPNARRAGEFKAAFLAAGGAEVVVGLLRAAALHASVVAPKAECPDHDAGVPEMVAGCVRLLGHLMVQGDARGTPSERGAGGLEAVAAGARGERAHVVPGLVERAFRHCLRSAPGRLLTEDVYDAALRAALDTAGRSGISSDGGGGSGEDAGAEHFARELTLAGVPSSFVPATVAMLGVVLESLPWAPPVVQRRALRDALLLTCSNADSRGALVGLPEWPGWLVKVLVRAKAVKLGEKGGDSGGPGPGPVGTVDLLDMGGDLLDIQLQHAMRQRDGWRTVEAVIRAFEEEEKAAGGGAVEDGNELIAVGSMELVRKMLVDMTAFAATELRGLSSSSSSSAPVRSHRRIASMGAIDYLDEEVGGGDGSNAVPIAQDNPLGVMRENSLALLHFVFGNLRGARQGCWGTNGAGHSHAGLPVDAIAYDRVETALAHVGSHVFQDPEGEWCRRCWLADAGDGSDVHSSGNWEEEDGKGKGARDGGLGKAFGGKRDSLDLLRGALGVIELLVNSSGWNNPVSEDSSTEVLHADETRHVMLCLTVTAVREESLALASPASPLQSSPSSPVVPPSVVDTLAAEGVGAHMSPAAAIAFESRAIWGVGPDTTLGKALAVLHHLLAPALAAGPPPRAARPPMATIGLLYDEVWLCHALAARDGARARGDVGTRHSNVAPHAKAMCAYLVGLLGRWRTGVAAECSNGADDGSGTMAAAAAASAVLSDARELRRLLGGESGGRGSTESIGVGEACSRLCTPPWVGVLGSPAVATALAVVTSGGGNGPVSTSVRALHPGAIEARRAAERVARRAQSEAFDDFAAAWSRGGVTAIPMASRWKQVLYGARSRQTLAGAAGKTSALRAGKTWRAFAQHLLEAGTLFVRLTPPEDDSEWRHPALMVSPMETGRRRRHQLRRSYTSMAYRPAHGMDDARSGGVRGTSGGGSIEKLRLPYAGVSSAFGSSLRDVVEDGSVGVSVGAEADEAERLLMLAEEEKQERDQRVMIAAAAAAAAAAVGRGEESSCIMQCDADLVTPMGVASGRLVVTTRAITFQSRANQSCTEPGPAGPTPETTFTPPDDPHLVDAVGGGAFSSAAAAGEHEWRWDLDMVHSVQTRRYLLRRSALEIFLLDRSAYFVDLRSQEQRMRVYSTIAGLKPRHSVPMFLEAASPEALLRKSDLTARWCRREMSNFDYLMALNTLAGRTYNDITQYPVFPWVIADYTSAELDLSNPGTFRDLSKPVGALDQARLSRFKERYDAFDDPEIPKFHYGSHYSSAGIVLFYLLRLEPFTTLSHQLQGGKFDHADRLFHDVGTVWRGVTSDMSDVKELIPEWYYLPEMFTNVNRVEFGSKQTGQALDAVVLPPWAKDPFDFVAKNRAALESEHVSKNLHHWIDLVFGHKQRGRWAEEATNVFYYLTYEGAVDMEAITDPVLLKATQDQIANFGQTPSQLLTKPHPSRLSSEDTFGGSHWLLANPLSACKYPLEVPGESSPAAHIAVAPEQMIMLTAGMEVTTHRWLPNTPDGARLPFTFVPGREPKHSLGFLRHLGARKRSSGGSESSSGTVKISVVLEPELAGALALAKKVEAGAHSRGSRGDGVWATVASRLPSEVTPDGRLMILGGHADGSVKIYRTDVGGTAVCSVKAADRGVVSAVALSSDGRILVTASTDSSLAVWTLAGPTEGGGSSLIGGGGGAGGGGKGGLGGGGSSSVRLHPGYPTGWRQVSAPDAFFAGEDSTVASAMAGGLIGGCAASHTGACLQDARARAGVTSTSSLSAAASGNHGAEGVPVHGRGLLRGPHYVLKGHREGVARVAVSTDLGIVVAVSPRAGSTFHCLLSGRFLRAIPELRGDLVAVSSEGLIAVWERRHNTVRLATVNGDIVHAASFEGTLPLFSALVVAADGDYIIVGTEAAAPGTGLPAGVVVLSVPDLRVLHVWELSGNAGVAALALTGDNTNLVVSATNGMLTIIADPRLSMRIIDSMFSLGWDTMV